MTALISYGIGYTANSAAATSLVIQPPPVYASGDLLVMGVIAGGASGGVAPALPSGWTRQSTSGATLALFTKVATSSESAYTVTLGGTSAAAGFVAAYPAATVASTSAGSSGSNVASWTATFPSGVTAGQTVLMLAGTVANSFSAGDPGGDYDNTGANVNLPSGWATDVPVFGPVNGSNIPSDDSDALPCALGLAEVTGSTGNPALTAPIGGILYAGFLVLNITGVAPTPYMVTATSQAPAGAIGMALAVKQLTGAATPAQITAGGATASFYNAGTSDPPELPLTPNATGSIVYGVITDNVGVTSGNTYTAMTGTTFSLNVADTVNPAIYGTLESTGTTTAATPITIGGTAPSNAQTVAVVAEILKATGKTLTEVATATVSATQPGQYYTQASAQTAVFAAAPAPGTLLVAMVSANSSSAVTISDTYGLTWTLLTSSVTPGYAGVFIAQVPTPPPFAYLTPPGRSSPMAWQRTARPTSAPPMITTPDAWTGTEAASVIATVTGTDTGAGTEGQSATPGAYAPDSFTGTDTQVLEVTGTDTGAGADTGSIPALGDAGAGTEGATVEPVGADTGTGTEATSATTVITADTAAGTEGAGGITVRPLITVRWSAADRLSKSGGTMP